MSIKLILVAILLGGASTQASANCLKAWGPEMKKRPEVTCAPITEQLLESLERASKAEVVKTMKNVGRPAEAGLHFNSVAERYAGNVNLEFVGNYVVRVHALVDYGLANKLLEFEWSLSNLPLGCSDFPGSDLKRCNQ
jgi:hypothetical protein